MIFADENIIKIKALTSGKPGGQNANRKATKIQARVFIKDLPVSEKDKKLILKQLPKSHLTEREEIIVENKKSRSQELNKQFAVEHINKLIIQALETSPLRIPTVPPKSVREIQTRAKKMRSEKKKIRKSGSTFLESK